MLPREFETSNEKTRFILGRNQQQNDFIVRQAKKENKNFWWFHGSITSCHAILFTDEKKLTKNQIQEVASKIQQYSKLKNMNNGYVVYTQIKFINLQYLKF